MKIINIAKRSFGLLVPIQLSVAEPFIDFATKEDQLLRIINVDPIERKILFVDHRLNERWVTIEQLEPLGKDLDSRWVKLVPTRWSWSDELEERLKENSSTAPVCDYFNTWPSKATHCPIEQCNDKSESVRAEVLVRQHRGSLANSMETVASIPATRAALEQWVSTFILDMPDDALKGVEVHPYGQGEDKRIGWDNLHIIDLPGYGVLGFSNGNFSD